MGLKPDQFVKGVDENLFCAICHEVFQDPVSCKDGHTFCKDCIHEWLKTNEKCPMDNGFLTKEHLVRVLMASGIIDNLEVYCHPRTTQHKPSEGCDWVGKLQHLTQHRKTCPFQEVQCSHVGCNQTMLRRELEHHEEICDFRKVECEICGVAILQHEKDKHTRDDCLQALICCPNRCSDKLQQLLIVKVKRINMPDHLSNVCPKAQVDCPYKEQGCEVNVERQDVEKHVQENMAEHMMLLAKECSSLKKQCSFLSLRCSTFAQENLELKNELQQMKDEFHNQLLGNSSYTWVVRDYPNLAKNPPNGPSIKSPPFWLRGNKWCISLYPNGNTKDETGFVSLFLKKIEEDSQSLSNTMPITSHNETEIPYRLTVISQKPDTDDVSRESKSIFTEPKNTWGWTKFMKSSDAFSPSYCNNGRLIIQCTILPNKPE
ncbi:TNF receptor-associated factor family protein DDB_G0290931-like [Actinia tenebrosa]|uniref:TNF receptor-associated factor family protein DDB_G0290931-like n=1 Tax=Actinia tenebrosa TaxID=6105 RepID=A0A6P8H8Q2_ACTTE|nr:TNF receptor-associated factor family protein DDB_G0290931-like [Actinia tenebrosa]